VLGFIWLGISCKIILSSTDEDALNFCRPSSHLHNLIHTGDGTQSQMSDSRDVDLACGTSNRYSDVTWDTG